MYKDYNMTQLTQTSVLIPTNDISRHVNDIIETIPETEFDAFICPNNKRLGFKRYAYRHDKYSFKRDFKLIWMWWLFRMYSETSMNEL